MKILSVGRARGLVPLLNDLWIVVRQYGARGDDWTSNSIYLWGACL